MIQWVLGTLRIAMQGREGVAEEAPSQAEVGQELFSQAQDEGINNREFWRRHRIHKEIIDSD
jgi:hypothetical protein